MQDNDGEKRFAIDAQKVWAMQEEDISFNEDIANYWLFLHFRADWHKIEITDIAVPPVLKKVWQLWQQYLQTMVGYREGALAFVEGVDYENTDSPGKAYKLFNQLKKCVNAINFSSSRREYFTDLKDVEDFIDKSFKDIDSCGFLKDSLTQVSALKNEDDGSKKNVFQQQIPHTLGGLLTQKYGHKEQCVMYLNALKERAIFLPASTWQKAENNRRKRQLAFDAPALAAAIVRYYDIEPRMNRAVAQHFAPLTNLNAETIRRNISLASGKKPPTPENMAEAGVWLEQILITNPCQYLTNHKASL